MAGFKVEQAVCTGRGFSPGAPNGMLEKLKAFAPRALTSGGAGWYLHDDQSALGTDPYIVISTHNAAGPTVVAKYIQVRLPTSTSGQIYVYYYLYWNPTTHKGFGLYGAYNVPTLDSADFIYDFRGGPECFFIQTLTATTWNGTFVDEWTPDPNLIDSVSATTSVANYTNGGTHQLRTFGITTGSSANLVDANGKFYVNVVNVSGTTWRIDAYNNTDRASGHLVAQSTNFSNPGSGVVANISLSQQNSSGLTLFANILGNMVADTSIVWTYTKITVGSGEGAQFVVNNFYAIYDFTLNQTSVNFFQVISKAGDVLTVDRLYLPFPNGTKIGSYPHNFIACGDGALLKQSRAGIPYYSTIYGTSINYAGDAGSPSEQKFYDWTNLSTNWSGIYVGPSAGASTDDGYINRLSPDRKGRYAVQRPGIFEVYSYGRLTSQGLDGQSGYGQMKNVIAGVAGSMSPNLHGRKLSGIDYTYFRTLDQYLSATGFAAMFRETQSNT